MRTSQPAPGTLYFLLSDHLGSTSITTDANGGWRIGNWGAGSVCRYDFGKAQRSLSLLLICAICSILIAVVQPYHEKG